MKRVYDKTILLDLANNAQLERILNIENIEYSAFFYNRGEYLCQPCEEEEYFQIVISGEVSVYHIRDDGSKYSLAQGSDLFLLGDLEFYKPSPSMFFAEALTDTISIAISLKKYRKTLQSNNYFLNFLVEALTKKLSRIAQSESFSSSLEDRVMNHLKFHCENGVLSGIEKTAFRLHCSDRQLQRILNNLELQNILKKCGKGKYALL